MFLCKNYVRCGNHIAKPGLCDACKKEARLLSEEVDKINEEEKEEQDGEQEIH